MSVFDYLDTEPGPPPPPRMADLWEWARDDYLAGESADVVCERHRLSRSQFFERARKEGWRRRDQPRRSAEAARDAEAYDADADDAFVEDALNRPPPSAYALYRQAWARAERAILAGRRVEAAGWTRLARDLRKLALQEHNAAHWKTVAAAEEPDSPDSASHRRGAPLHPASPAQAGAQGTPVGDRRETSPSASTAPTWAPACAGEAEGSRPDSPDSPSAPLNRQKRRRLAKLGSGRPPEKPRPGFRSAEAMG